MVCDNGAYWIPRWCSFPYLWVTPEWTTRMPTSHQHYARMLPDHINLYEDFQTVNLKSARIAKFSCKTQSPNQYWYAAWNSWVPQKPNNYKRCPLCLKLNPSQGPN